MGEDMGPDHLRVVSPGKRPRDQLDDLFGVFSFILRVCFLFRSLCIMYMKMVFDRNRPAKRRAQNPQGRSFFFASVIVCCLGGGSLGGGDLVSPRCLGPSRSTPEGLRGGPWAPPPRLSFASKFRMSWFVSLA